MGWSLSSSFFSRLGFRFSNCWTWWENNLVKVWGRSNNISNRVRPRIQIANSLCRDVTIKAAGRRPPQKIEKVGKDFLCIYVTYGEFGLLSILWNQPKNSRIHNNSNKWSFICITVNTRRAGSILEEEEPLGPVSSVPPGAKHMENIFRRQLYRGKIRKKKLF